MLVRVMNWVSRHILLAPFMCLFLLFGSCGSSHKAVKSDVEVISKDSTSESVNIVHGSATSLSELITTNGNYVIDFRIYDTRKPSDSLTGKPPLLADGHVEGDFSKNKRKETAIKDSTEVKRDNQAIAITSVIITLVGIFIMFEVSALVGMIIYLIAFALSFNELRKDPEFRPETIVPFAKKCLSKENFKGMGLMFLVVAILPLMAVIGSYRWIVTDTYREVESMYNDYY